MEQIKQTVLSAGKDAWNFLTGVTMSAAQSVSWRRQPNGRLRR